MRWAGFGLVFGFLGNIILDAPTDRIFPSRGLNLMARYTVGGVLTLTVAAIMLRKALPPAERLAAFNIFATSFLSVGAGVGFARALRELERGA
jgi:hypothetical protein